MYFLSSIIVSDKSQGNMTGIMTFCFSTILSGEVNLLPTLLIAQ